MTPSRVPGTAGNENKNPLIRDGSARSKRELPALSPDHVKVDEKDLADFLIFADKLSDRITYYDLNNQTAGNWRNFFKRNDPIQIAYISKARLEYIRNDYSQAVEDFLDLERPAPIAILEESREEILTIYTKILDSLHTWYEGLTNNSPLRSTIYATANAKLSFPLQQLISLDANSQRQKTYRKVASRFKLDVSNVPQNTSLQSIFLGDIDQARDTLSSIFRPLFQVYSQIVTQLAPQALHDSLYSDQSIQPHIALYVAFWETLKCAQDDLNTMTHRHLDFFYRDVLRLLEQPAIPDKAHIILELEKSQSFHKLERHRKLNAGTDATGVDVLYTLDQDIVVNNTQVVELKGLFLQTQKNKQIFQGHYAREILDLRTSAMANSYDGQGGAFPKELPLQAWQPFGDQNRPAARLGLAIASNLLLLGEGDRTVTFTFTLKFPTGLKPNLSGILPESLKKDAHLEFSSDADWIGGEIQEISLDHPAEQSNLSEFYTLTIKVFLPVDAAAVVPYHGKLSGGKLATDRPVARLFFCHQDNNIQNSPTSITSPGASAYHYLHHASVQAIHLSTEVNSIRNLIVQNDFSVLDATKPFQPFGFQPTVGSNFYIGSQEVFQKKLTKLQISFDLEKEPPNRVEPENPTSRRKWETIYGAYHGVKTDFNPGLLTVQVLKRRRWYPESNDIENNLFSEGVTQGLGTNYSLELDNSQTLEKLTLNTNVEQPINAISLEPWSYQSHYGFLKLQLKKDDFLHAAYPNVLTRQTLAAIAVEIQQETKSTASTEAESTIPRVVPKLVEGAYYKKADGTIVPSTKAKVPGDIPLLAEEPYTPTIQSLQISYQASDTQDSCQLFHLHPFDGVAALPNQPLKEHPINLLPQFDHEGELLLGLQNLEPLTSLSLLFQVAPETADTDLKKTLVHWYYLVDNSWKRLEDHLIEDGSNGLIHSGIVKLSIPADISKAETTILNPTLNWIKATVDEDSGAIPHIVNIHTQAAAVTFVDSSNDPNYLATPLPEKSITELIEQPPEIKSVQQPYPSFNGKIKEQSNHFYMRVSERLRHKGRAVTIFDYEHLVLERFPEIYKVRCINHGEMANDRGLNEIAPGHVTVAVVPELSQRRTLQDLEPRVNINLLSEIQAYLKRFSSPWSTIQVVNPEYEMIRVEFSMQLKPEFQPDFEFYRRQLQREIIRFLSPWAITGADGENEIHFGGKIYRSSILKFVEDQPYVDYIIYFGLYKENSDENQSSVSAKTAHSILVPAPFDDSKTGHHKIAPIDPPLLSYAGEVQLNNNLGYNPLSRLTIMGD